jgi:hypothetical protein
MPDVIHLEPVSVSISVLLLYDVSEEIRLEQLRDLIGAPAGRKEPAFPYPTPEYVRFSRPPVVETIEPIALPDGRQLTGQVAYYDYGVLSFNLAFRFTGTWRELSRLIAGSTGDSAVRRSIDEAMRQKVERARPALVKPNIEYLDEDYFVVHLTTLFQEDGSSVPIDRILQARAESIVQIVRADDAPVSASESRDTLLSGMSYSPTDYFLPGWTAAFVYDTPEGARAAIQLLEYANTQLLEFRYYDEVLTRLLAHVYSTLDGGTGFFRRWRLAREATRLNTIRLDVRELTERVDNSIKFLGDMYSARFYRLTASKVGVPDYRRLVEDKLRAAQELYSFMMDQFHQGRAFVLELMVVVILLIELFYFFQGKM